MRAFVCSAILAAGLLSASAIPLDYQIGDGSRISVNNVEPGLVIRAAIDPGLPGRTFTLNDGQSTTFDFFSIWTDEPIVDRDDFSPRLITATLNFEVPEVDAQVHGITFGGRLIYQSGVVLWDDPVLIHSGDRVFSVNLNNALFDLDKFKLGNSPATITATVKQVSSTGTPQPARVPDGGATVVLLGAGLAAVAWLRRTARH